MMQANREKELRIKISYKKKKSSAKKMSYDRKNSRKRGA